MGSSSMAPNRLKVRSPLAISSSSGTTRSRSPSLPMLNLLLPQPANPRSASTPSPIAQIRASHLRLSLPVNSCLPPIFQQQQIEPQVIHATGLPVEEVEYATIGGGLGSFIWVDLLRIGGVSTEQVRVLGDGATTLRTLSATVPQ